MRHGLLAGALAGLIGLGGVASAAEYRGLPLERLPELGLDAVSFEHAEEGWTAQFPKGLARLYVAPDAARLDAWIARKQALLARRAPEPYPALVGPHPGDAAWGDATGLLLVRRGNIGLLVETTEGAHGWAEALLGALDPAAQAWPAPPTLRAMPSGVWVAAGETGVHLSYRGGEIDPDLAPGAPLTFLSPPDYLVAWDPWGRSSVLWLDEAGNPTEPPPPPPVQPAD